MRFRMKIIKGNMTWTQEVRAKTRKKGYRKLFKRFQDEAKGNKKSAHTSNLFLSPGIYQMEFSEIIESGKTILG